MTKVHPDDLLSIIEDYSKQMDFKEIIPISATEGNNFEHLMDVLVEQMPEGPQYFLMTKLRIIQNILLFPN